MKRILCIVLTLAMTLSTFLSLVSTIASYASAGGTHYSYKDIVKRTYDMSFLATKGKKGEGGKQITSTDRSSKYNEVTGKYENWDANGDNTGYVRQEGGMRVIADLEGPGYVNHIMTGLEWDGKLQIIIDGERVIDTSFVNFVWGSYFKEFDQLSFKSNDVYMFNSNHFGMINLAVPITYNESCVIKIAANEGDTFYYTVGYYDLEDGATVEPFKWPLGEDNMAALREANEKLNDKSVPNGDSKFKKSIGSGESVVLFEDSNAGSISGTSLKIDIPELEFDKKTSLVEWEIAMYWDGSDDPAVRMSVADFYGTPYGKAVFDSAGYGVAEDGTLYSTWYMPYNKAKITLTNNSDKARNVSASFVTEDISEEKANELLRFHANWQRAYQRTDDRYPDAQWLKIEGEGRYVGASHHVYQLVDSIWWGEGDEKFFIDGEKYPTWYGTGSEDYFWYAWCASTVFSKAYCGQPLNEGSPSTGERQLQGHGDKINYRIHVADSVCFSKSFEACIDKYYNDECVKYGDTTYFYLTKETSGNHIAQKQNMEERLFNNSISDSATLFYPGIYLMTRQIFSNTSVLPWAQSMKGVCEGVSEWFGDAHLFWQPTSDGKFMEFEINIPESDTYDFFVSKTLSWDYGEYTFYLDGKEIGTTDFYGRPVAQENETVGSIVATKGEHVLRIEASGKNGESGGYYVGINYIEFKPKNIKPAEDNSSAVHSEKESAKNSLVSYANEAYEKADEIQTERIRRAVSFAKAEICTLSSAEEVNAALSSAKGKIDTILATKYVTELEVDYDPNASKEVYYKGSSDLLSKLTSHTLAEAPHDQGLSISVSDDGSHLFSRTSEGDELNFSMDIPAKSKYDITVAFTCYRDFCIFELYIDDVKIGEEYDAFDTEILVKQAIVEGVELTKGNHKLTVKCVGKNPMSSGTVLGIDYIQILSTGAKTELEAYSDAAKQQLEGYKVQSDYTEEQWNKLLEILSEQKEKIDSAKTVASVIETWQNAMFLMDEVPLTHSSISIYYDANGGKGSTQTTVITSGSEGSVAENAFTKEGYIFKGWNTSADGSGKAYAAGDKISTDTSLTLFAQWEKLASSEAAVTTEPTEDDSSEGGYVNTVIVILIVFIVAAAVVLIVLLAVKKKK